MSEEKANTKGDARVAALKAKRAKLKAEEAKLLREIVTHDNPELVDAITGLSAPIDILNRLDDEKGRALSATATKRRDATKVKLEKAKVALEGLIAKIEDLKMRVAGYGGEEGHEEVRVEARGIAMAQLGMAIEEHTPALEGAKLSVEDVFPESMQFVDELLAVVDSGESPE